MGLTLACKAFKQCVLTFFPIASYELIVKSACLCMHWLPALFNRADCSATYKFGLEWKSCIPSEEKKPSYQLQKLASSWRILTWYSLYFSLLLSQVWMCLYASMYLDVLCVYLGWLCSLSTLHRGDDLLIKRTHLFRWGIWRGLRACFSHEINTPFFCILLPDKHLTHGSTAALQRLIWKKHKEQKFWKFYFVIRFWYLWYPSLAHDNLDFNSSCNETVLLINPACKMNITSGFLQIINEFSSLIPA